MKNPKLISLLLLMLAFGGSAMAESGCFVPDRVRTLNSVIDSLSIEKEALIRSGRAVTELDARISLYNDSMLLCRNSLENDRSSAAADAIAKIKLPPNPFQAIEDFFGNFVLVIGAGVALSILLFAFFFIFSIIRHRKKAVRKTPILLRDSDRKKSAGPAKAVVIQAQNSGPKKMHADPTEEVIELSIAGEACRPKPPISVSVPPQKKPAPLVTEALVLDDFNLLILEAARQGMSAREISCRYQISTDRVALQLALAKKS